MAAHENHPAWDQIERDVTFDPGNDRTARAHRPGEHEIELSKAISLKRIADLLEKATGECGDGSRFFDCRPGNLD